MLLRKQVIELVKKEVNKLEETESFAFRADRPKEELRAIRDLEMQGIQLLGMLIARDDEITPIEMAGVQAFHHMMTLLLEFLKGAKEFNYKLN